MTEDEFNEYSEKISEVVELSPIKNAAMKRSTIHKGTSDGIKFDSKWEYIVYRYERDIAGSIIERNTVDWLPYIDELGKQRKFFYDFTCNGQYLEVKGFWKESDYQKQEQCPQVKFLSKDDVLPMLAALRERFGDQWDTSFVRSN
jgi:hypothetical protein